MKKSALLFILLIWTVLPLAAQQNLLFNGDFEATVKTFSYETVYGCPVQVPGWDTVAVKNEFFNNVGLDRYNIRATMGTFLPATTGGSQYLRIQRYEWDGWSDGGIQQTIPIEPSTTYTLSFLYRLSIITGSTTTPLVPAWYRVYQDSTITVLSKALYNYNIDIVKDSANWFTITKNFTTSASAKNIRVNLGITGGKLYSWGGSIGFYGDFDNVKLVKVGSVGLMQMPERENIKSYIDGDKVYLSGLSMGEVAVFDLSGRKISSVIVNRTSMEMILPGKGFYIIRNDNRFVKVRY